MASPPLFWGVESTWIFLTYPEWVFIKVRRFTFHHFNGHDPQRPDINFWTISFSSYHLRCHPVGSSHHSASFTLLRSDLSTEPKISCREEKSIKMGPNNFFAIVYFPMWPTLPLMWKCSHPDHDPISQLLLILKGSESIDKCEYHFRRIPYHSLLIPLCLFTEVFHFLASYLLSIHSGYY